MKVLWQVPLAVDYKLSALARPQAVASEGVKPWVPLFGLLLALVVLRRAAMTATT